MDTTFTWSGTWVSDHSEVSLFTPTGSPRVSDNPEFGSVFDTVSDSSDTVVQSSSARSLEDTRMVGHDSVSINSNRNDGLVNSIHQLLSVVLWNINVSSNVSDWGTSSLARSLDSSVWVSCFSLDTVLLDVGESVVHPSTVTTVVSLSSGAINQLLFRQRGQWVTSNFVGGFNRGDSGESPTGTTLSLVLDWVNSSLSSPINTFTLGKSVFEEHFVSLSSSERVTGVLGQEFFLGEVRELVKSDTVSLSGDLFGGDSEEVLVEDSKSESSFGRRSVGLSVLHGPLSESRVNWSWDIVSVGAFGLEKTSSDQKCSSSNNDEDFVHFFIFFVQSDIYMEENFISKQ